MKKLLLIILIFALTGCSPKFGADLSVDEKINLLPTELRLKADTDKIIKTDDVSVETCLSYENTGSTSALVVPRCLSKKVDSFKEYEYVSDVVATNKPYYSQGNDYSSAEYLPERVDGVEPIAYYAEKKWFKGSDGKNYEIKKATTTVEAFNLQDKESPFKIIKSFFGGTAIATTTYDASTTYTPECAGTVSVLVVGGGASGGTRFGGGGGAGGVISSSSYAVTVQSYTVTVGDGGAAMTTNYSIGNRGATSTFGVISAAGGGAGAQNEENASTNGGSGGGSANVSARVFSRGITGQGSDGGYLSTSLNDPYPSGGGGGASAVGQSVAGNATTAGNGGAGVANTITGASVTYGGGGGGGIYRDNTAGSGGAGGGGAGSKNGAAATAGTDGLGGGGGGHGGDGTSGSGKGGDGVVIVAFLGTCEATPTSSLIPLQGVMLFD